MRERGTSADPVVGVDATYTAGRELSGVGRYSLRLMEGLAALGQPLKRFYRPHRWWKAAWPKRVLWESGVEGVDLFHGLNQRLPRRGRAPMVSTFHDLFVLSEEYSTAEFRERFAGQAREAAERSDHIIAVSEFTARQVVESLGYPRERITVVPHGVDWPEAARPAAERERIVLTVGAVQKRKNTKRMIEAFRAMGPDWEFWIAGSAGFGAGEMLADCPGNVKVLGYVSDAELGGLYERAAILAFASLDEGFGIPVLEGMAHGMAVMTGKRSALPEVAGEAGVLVDPFSVEEMAEALLRMRDVSVREELGAKGRERARGYSWVRAARETQAVYRRMVSGGDLRQERS
jgi:glycosyltransferase involved in cell wall biosynthesis